VKAAAKAAVKEGDVMAAACVMRSLAVAMSGPRNYKNGDAQELVGQIERRRASPPSSW
jgi:hypothetical protein